MTVHGSDTFSDRFANKGLHTLPGHASGEIEANEGCEKLNSTARIDLTLVVLGLVGLPSIHQTPRSPSASFSRHHQPHSTCGESVSIAGEETLLERHMFGQPKDQGATSYIAQVDTTFHEQRAGCLTTYTLHCRLLTRVTTETSRRMKQTSNHLKLAYQLSAWTCHATNGSGRRHIQSVNCIRVTGSSVPTWFCTLKGVSRHSYSGGTL